MSIRRGRATSVLSLIVLVAFAAGGCSGSAATASPAPPTVSDAWARPAMSTSEPGVAYLTIKGGSADDALVGASSPQAGSVELNETSMDSSGMAGMKPVDRIDVPAGATVSLKPGGYHLMVMGLSKPLEAGQTLELQLRFEHAGTVTVQAEVRPA